MPYTNTDPALPFSGAVALSRHTSHAGAVDAAERVGRQCLALLTLYRRWGPLTDRQAAERLGIERSTINARRGDLVKRGLVVAVDTVVAATGIRNVRWGVR